jgi:hypothetical protein
MPFSILGTFERRGQAVSRRIFPGACSAPGSMALHDEIAKL